MAKEKRRKPSFRIEFLEVEDQSCPKQRSNPLAGVTG